MMKHFFIFFSLLMISVSGWSQMEIEKTTHDFGEIYENSPTYVDFTFKNIGQSKAYLLTIDNPRHTQYIYSSKLVLSDSTVTIRIKINENIKGKFNYQVDVYFSNSNQPISLKLIGNVKVRNNNPMTACPDFNTTPSNNGMVDFDVTIKVLDSITNEPIRRSRVYLINNGQMIGTYYTNSQGIIRKSVPLGLYYITAEKEPYNSNFHDGYLNAQDNYVEIRLSKNPDLIPEIVEEEIIVIEEEEIVETIEIEERPVETIEIEEEETVIEEIVVVEEVIEEELVELIPVDTSTGFNSPAYAPNHIVFIVDVSSSMKQMGKLDLLKYSMIELTKILRPQDKVTLISYAGTVKVLLDQESGLNQEKIINQVQALKAGGYTDGGAAIKQGIKMAKQGFIEGGNNLVFLVTDGAFNKGTNNYVKNIELTHKSKGIKFSVVGIKTTDYLTNHMTKIATKGGGAYIRIITVDDAKNKLFEEVKRTSLKND